MGRHCSATVISWSLTHYRVTTVWLHVEADHTTLGKFSGEDCGLEGSCPQMFDCLVQRFWRMFSENCKKEEKPQIILITVKIGSRVVRFGSLSQK